MLLLESGPSDAGIASIAAAGSWAGLLGGGYDWGHSYGATALTAGRPVPIPRGRVLGGSSSINAMLWYRGHPSDYDGWAAAGATGWDYAALLPYFKRSEDWEGGETPYRGAGGPMRIERPRDPHPVAAALLEGASELGFAVIDDPNSTDPGTAGNEGATLANLNATTGADGHSTRWSTVRGYLDPAAGWPNLHVRTDSHTVSLDFESERCVGVRVGGASNEVETIRAVRGVVLTAGAIETPRLLMLSGVGDPSELARIGVPVHVGLAGVGANLQDHPLLMGMNFRAGSPLGPVRDNGGGSMLNWRSSTARGKADLHAFVVQGSHATPEVVARYGLDGSDPRVFAISPGLMDSRSVGRLRLTSSDVDAPIDLQPNFLAEPDDLEALIEAVEVIFDLAATSGYRALGATPAAPDARLTRTEKITFVRSSVSTFFHTCGTAAMGTGELAVVDPSLAVYGTTGLWVADASVMPTIPTANTQAPVIAIAERAADLIRPRQL